MSSEQRDTVAQCPQMLLRPKSSLWSPRPTHDTGQAAQWAFEEVLRSPNAAWTVLSPLLLTLARAPSEITEHRVKDSSMLGCLPTVVPGPHPLQAGSCCTLGLASADGAGGVHTESDILSSEVIAGGVVLREPDDAHDSVDELDHQNGCKKR